MWEAIVAAGWVTGILVAAALGSFIVSVLGFLFLIIVKPTASRLDDL